jgi:multicomponent Na+:H+ antiporter subunit G
VTAALTALLVLVGGFFVFAAALGVARLPDVLIRMHASTKAGTLGCGLILLAAAIHFAETAIVARALATIVFIMLTAPVGAHMIARAAYRTGVPLWRGMVVDELGREPAAGGSGKQKQRDEGESQDRGLA